MHIGRVVEGRHVGLGPEVPIDAQRIELRRGADHGERRRLHVLPVQRGAVKHLDAQTVGDRPHRAAWEGPAVQRHHPPRVPRRLHGAGLLHQEAVWREHAAQVGEKARCPRHPRHAVGLPPWAVLHGDNDQVERILLLAEQPVIGILDLERDPLVLERRRQAREPLGEILERDLGRIRNHHALHVVILQHHGRHVPCRASENENPLRARAENVHRRQGHRLVLVLRVHVQDGAIARSKLAALAAAKGAIAVALPEHRDRRGLLVPGVIQDFVVRALLCRLVRGSGLQFSFLQRQRRPWGGLHWHAQPTLHAARHREDGEVQLRRVVLRLDVLPLPERPIRLPRVDLARAA
mmetsp:Transcript_128935/g.360766  ORF Transcript_128935/g.360766 Transcript_128935/m.360766 type:complete len:350 (-) Transcript_128935:12-1061(-)